MNDESLISFLKEISTSSLSFALSGEILIVLTILRNARGNPFALDVGLVFIHCWNQLRIMEVYFFEALRTNSKNHSSQNTSIGLV
jgi:hypothetical protein